MLLGSEAWRKLVVDGAAQMGLDLTPEHTAAFARHAEELLRWNRKINLTTITEPQEVALKHFVDCLAPVPMIPQGVRVLDIGSGGGYPGIPLAVVRPDLHVILIDASRKKVSFLKHLIRTLTLTHTQALHTRSESLAADPEYAQAFGVIVCRAFAALDDFMAASRPLLARGGLLIALKGPRAVEKGRWVAKSEGAKSWSDPELGFRIDLHPYNLPILGDERTLVTMHRLRTD